MGEQEPPRATLSPPLFGQPLPPEGRGGMHLRAAPMFPTGEDLPLFSGTPIPVDERPYIPEDHSMKQALLPGMPEIDYDAVLAKDKEFIRRRHKAPAVLPPAGDIFTAIPTTTTVQATEAPQPRAQRSRERGRKQPEEGHQLREALAPYLSLPELRQLAAHSADLTRALITTGEIPPDVLALLEVCTVLFRPTRREQIKSPADVAALLMVEMSYLEQEQMRVVCLNTRNRLQKVHLVYQGSLNASMVRVGEFFREPLKLNSASVIIAHNHPSGEPNPSPEDILVTGELVKAGKLLDVEVLDHLIIGQGRWVSLREKGLGFSKDLSDLT